MNPSAEQLAEFFFLMLIFEGLASWGALIYITAKFRGYRKTIERLTKALDEKE